MLNLPESTTTNAKLSMVVVPENDQEQTSYCRLCHRLSSGPNIFEATLDYFQQGNIADFCHQVLGVQYERHESLPESICSYCLELLEDIFEHRKGLEEREMALQAELKELLKQDPRYRPGLNGNPGVFEPEEGCVIVSVDPDKLSETSEDEFLMGSDGDEEEGEEEEDEDGELDEDEEDDEENGEETEIPLGMDAAQMARMQISRAGEEPVNQIDTMEFHMARPKLSYHCQYCDLGFTLQTDCTEHENSSHDPAAPFGCSYCNLTLTTRPALIAHIKMLHDADRPYVCAQCRKPFVRRSDLKKHALVHTGIRPFTCQVCSKSFSRNTNLTKHMRIHSSVKPFVCQQCPRSFQTAVEMMRHMRSHEEIKPFQCQRCPYSSSRKDKLMAHQQVHQKRDSVEQQNQQLPQQPPPQQHFFTPTNKPKTSRGFRCDVCDRSFQRERDLQRHRALHMDTLFACKICQQGFNRREQLQRHELEAHGPSYTCALCCISFLQQVELENHLKVHQLQHQIAKSTQEAMHNLAEQAVPVPVVPPQPVQMRPSAAELSFYSNMIPTMNLGFYSETRPEEE